MADNIKKANEIKIKTAIKNMERRHIVGHYAEDRQAAMKILLEMIPEGATVGKGGSQTLEQIGIVDTLRRGNYDYLDEPGSKTPEEKKELRRKCFSADFYLSSANAITMDGLIVNIDGNGNRVAATIWGPDQVVFVAGANKLVASEKDAIDRIKLDACPANCIRLGKTTPCAVTGVCRNCLTLDECICSYTVTIRRSPQQGRIHVILVNETLGY